MEEGYVKYSAEHTKAPPLVVPHWIVLNEARTRLRQAGLIGAHSNGVGFGNLSIRFQGNEFLITGTATGALPVLDAGKYCLVRSFDLKQNQVVTAGPVGASAETMSHGVIYRANSGVNCVIHTHSRKIFDGMIQSNKVSTDSYPATPESAPYGSPEIALAIEKCVHDSGKDEGQIVMLGHDEGVITFGPTIERALFLTLELYDKYSSDK